MGLLYFTRLGPISKWFEYLVGLERHLGSTLLKSLFSDSLYPNNSVSFSDAKEFCETKGMVLPVPKSPSENYLIWIEKEKTSDIILELIWLGIGSEIKFLVSISQSYSHYPRIVRINSRKTTYTTTNFDKLERVTVGVNKSVVAAKIKTLHEPFQE